MFKHLFNAKVTSEDEGLIGIITTEFERLLRSLAKPVSVKITLHPEAKASSAGIGPPSVSDKLRNILF
jgi:hypothetical protein